MGQQVGGGKWNGRHAGRGFGRGRGRGFGCGGGRFARFAKQQQESNVPVSREDDIAMWQSIPDKFRHRILTRWNCIPNEDNVDLSSFELFEALPEKAQQRVRNRAAFFAQRRAEKAARHADDDNDNVENNTPFDNVAATKAGDNNEEEEEEQESSEEEEPVDDATLWSDMPAHVRLKVLRRHQLLTESDGDAIDTRAFGFFRALPEPVQERVRQRARMFRRRRVKQEARAAKQQAKHERKRQAEQQDVPLRTPEQDVALWSSLPPHMCNKVCIIVPPRVLACRRGNSRRTANTLPRQH